VYRFTKELQIRRAGPRVSHMSFPVRTFSGHCVWRAAIDNAFGGVEMTELSVREDNSLLSEEEDFGMSCRVHLSGVCVAVDIRMEESAVVCV
jgi:hypothetical protein